jgi:hypothetical protein
MSPRISGYVSGSLTSALCRLCTFGFVPVVILVNTLTREINSSYLSLGKADPSGYWKSRLKTLKFRINYSMSVILY